MKAISKSIAVVVMGGSLIQSTFAATIVGREIHQQSRVALGVRTGALTAGENRRIEVREAALAHEVRHDRLTGGGLSAVERTRIERQKDRLSEDILRMKHNGRRD